MNIFLNILFLILIVIFILLAVLLFTKVTLVAKFKKVKGEKADFSLNLCFLGGLIKKDLLSLNLKEKNKEAHKSKEEVDLKFFEKVKKHYGCFLDFKSAYCKARKKIRRAIHAEKIQLSVDFGLGDAAKTGIATGSVWAGIYSVISFVASVIRITEPKIAVNPAYNELKCEAEGEAVIKARPINLIIAAASFGITYLKLRKIRENKNTNKKGGD